MSYFSAYCFSKGVNVPFYARDKLRHLIVANNGPSKLFFVYVIEYIVSVLSIFWTGHN